MKELNANFSKITGKIKPVHGFNNASRKTGYGELLNDFISLKAPIVRLHDTCGFYGGTHYVDIPNIFPDFSADASDEASYDFTLTDLYIKPIIQSGSQIMYRLGVTIEHAPVKYRVFPPENPEKWADICEHIVRHYNDGWAKGYHWNIKYWEIWNEPDGLHKNIEPNGPPMWNGTALQYYELYSLTANKIKSMHPDVLVGGYSSCYILGAFTGERWTEGPTEFFTDFLEYISSEKTKAPLDFFSYHGYLGKNYLQKIEKEYTFVKSTLKKYGFENTQIHDTEWNTNICTRDVTDTRTEYYINMRNEKGASHAAAALYEMQRLGLDCAMFYDAQLWWEYGCLFNVPELTPTKTYYAFKRFSEMYTLGNACEVNSSDGIYACGATGKYNMLGISNVTEITENITLRITGNKFKAIKIYETSGEKTDEMIFEAKATEKYELELKPYSFLTLIFADEA